MLAIGDSIPDLEFETTEGKIQRFSSLLGKFIVLYFYPKDHTSGCTLEAQTFRDHFPEFLKKNAVILGVSKDSIKSHCQFREKQQLPFDLISDTPEAGLCDLFGVWKEKSMYGKKYFGIERSTFLIDPAGKIQQIWRKVSVPGHVEAVLKALP